MNHEAHCTCRSCTGPAAWKILLASALPAVPPKASSSTSHHIDESESTRSKFSVRLPQWVCPASRLGMVSESSPVTAEITLDAILQGHTKSPITYQDLRRYLRHSSDGTNLAALDFLVAFKKFEESFLHLFPSDRPPHPYTVIEHLSLLQGGTPKPSTEATNSSPSFRPPSPSTPIPSAGLLGYRSHSRAGTSGSMDHPQPALATRFPARPRAATLQTGSQPAGIPKLDSFVNSLILDPSSQPLRPELEHIVRKFLTESMSHNLASLIPPQIMARTLSETKLTTHPIALQPIATFLHSYLSNDVVPIFLSNAVINLSRTTSLGRLLMALAVLAVAVCLTIIFILFETRIPRAARLALLPFYLISIGYAIGSRTSLCFWLTWRGVRETKQYEDEEKALVAERDFRANWTPHVDRFTPLEDLQTRKQKKSRRVSDSDTSNTGDSYRLSVYTLNETASEKGLLPSPRSPGYPRNRYYGPASKALYFASYKKKWTWENLVRLTGTAVNTVQVEDERIRKRQRIVALKVSIWLILGTVSIMTVVLVIP